MIPPRKVFTDAADHLDERRHDAELPPRHRVNPAVVAQPMDGSGYVYGQIGWLDDHGTAYGLQLPDGMCRDGTSLRPLYICLGRHGTPEHDPAVGDPVLVHGVIRNIQNGVAAVEIYRSWPTGVIVPVQCGALECDEQAAHAARDDDTEPGE